MFCAFHQHENNKTKTSAIANMTQINWANSKPMSGQLPYFLYKPIIRSLIRLGIHRNSKRRYRISTGLWMDTFSSFYKCHNCKTSTYADVWKVCILRFIFYCRFFFSPDTFCKLNRHSFSFSQFCIKFRIHGQMILVKISTLYWSFWNDRIYYLNQKGWIAVSSTHNCALHPEFSFAHNFHLAIRHK